MSNDFFFHSRILQSPLFNIIDIRSFGNQTVLNLFQSFDIRIIRISNIENGNTKPGVDVIVNIATALKVTPNQLLIDNLPETQKNKNDLNSLFLDCTPEEVSMVENFTGLKKVLSKYQIKE